MAENGATYVADGDQVRKAPIHKTNPDGSTRITVGFPVCTMTDWTTDDAADVVATLMNRGELITTDAELDVLTERRRQIEAEGWTPGHDDAHDNGEMAVAAICYADPDPYRCPVPKGGSEASYPPKRWPWHYSWWRPGRFTQSDTYRGRRPDRRRDLVKAAALLIAEIERLDRAASANPAEQVGAA